MAPVRFQSPFRRFLKFSKGIYTRTSSQKRRKIISIVISCVITGNSKMAGYQCRIADLLKVLPKLSPECSTMLTEVASGSAPEPVPEDCLIGSGQCLTKERCECIVSIDLEVT